MRYRKSSLYLAALTVVSLSLLVGCSFNPGDPKQSSGTPPPSEPSGPGTPPAATLLITEAGLWAAAVNPVTNTEYVINDNGTMSVIDGVTNALTATIQLGGTPYAMAINSVTNMI